MTTPNISDHGSIVRLVALVKLSIKSPPHLKYIDITFRDICDIMTKAKYPAKE
jgi:hypothetical protein